MTNLIVILGPTAIGKTTLAIRLARDIGGEIVSADSRQVYRYMDVGTAKPSAEERALARHHLIDIVDPDEAFSLALYQELASQAIADVERQGKVPILVGGSGLYVRALTGGFEIPRIPPDYGLRHALEERAERDGGQVLYHELEGIDPEAASRIDPRNIRRVVRALEVCSVSGKPFSQLQKRRPAYRTLVLGLTTGREDLYRRIDSRVDSMIQQGLVQEVQSLIESGYSLDLPAMSGLGYKQIGRYLQRGLALDEAVQQIKYETHRFARHQYAWFRLNDESIQWFDVRNAPESHIHSLALDFVDKVASHEVH